MRINRNELASLAENMNLSDDTAFPQKCLRASLKLPVTGLRVGMFVVEPDCGWRNTPFILEGLLISDTEEINVLASLTTHVTIDPRRSVVSSLTDADAASFYEDAAASPDACAPIEDAVASIPGNLEEQFEHFISAAYEADFSNRRPGLAERAGAGWRRWRSRMARFLHHGTGLESRPAPLSSRPDYIPREIPLVIYREPEPTAASLPQARSACIAVERTLKRIVHDIAESGSSNT